ncbi:hypothetical protein ABN028_19695 [Actinopolymorpha sp. B17G11]|uniref:hypothetical protein n=1 Tax=Actinopolymorpha sp. B17G11 TaxID=3160861 RepID=UPI0032E51484
MSKTYYETAKGLKISKAEAKRVIMVVHGMTKADWKLFKKERGNHATYDAQKVLDWLGY